MRLLVQRVSSASVEVSGQLAGAVGHGLLVLVGVGQGDAESDAVFLSKKLCGLRIFEDDQGKMSLSVRDIGGSLLLVSQFTLYADCRRGNRPSFDPAMEPVGARRLFERFVELCQAEGIPAQTGVFAAEMRVSLVNEGPVTIFLESPKN